jgi:hypothetical protein
MGVINIHIQVYEQYHVSCDEKTTYIRRQLIGFVHVMTVILSIKLNLHLVSCAATIHWRT